MANKKLGKMQKVYGQDLSHKCGSCCNCHNSTHKPGTRVCIAYGDVDYTDCAWNPNDYGCGLYNKPFHALTPERRPLVLVYGPKPPVKEDDDFAQAEIPGFTSFWGQN